MGVKELWSVLTPHADRKPMSELRGKTVAIDLAGWVCESLNVVDYFVHPRHHLKNLFFRTCYLIWEEVTPVFVLEGVAPQLKSQVIAKRNEFQFRGVKPKQKVVPTQSQTVTNDKSKGGRTRFNHVLKQCETLLWSMGIQCVQGPGEAEAYCAFLNKKGLVDGVISQDSDCFAYGAWRVYRNFSVSTQGAQAVQGGAVDIYDIRQISSQMDFGQHKIIVMALLCGCDYCPDGVGGIGRDGVLKLFNLYSEAEVLDRVRSWRREDSKYTAMEMRVDDKTICSNCGHLGRTQSHTKSGCAVCRTTRGCDETLWKNQRLALKSELTLRKKALADPNFPSEEIIAEFLNEPPLVPKLHLGWRQPNIVKFTQQIGKLLQWPEIYCFQKFFPILTRWQVRQGQCASEAYVELQEIIKKRTVKGVPSLEVVWHDFKGNFDGLIPDDQLGEYVDEKSAGVKELWTTVEPQALLEQTYPEMVCEFLKSKQKPLKQPKGKQRGKQKKQLTLQSFVAAGEQPRSSLDNLDALIAVTKEVAKSVNPKRAKKAPTSTKERLQSIDKFLANRAVSRQCETTTMRQPLAPQCSTPIVKCLPSDLDSDEDDDGTCLFDMSAIVRDIVANAAQPLLTRHAGRRLRYEAMPHNLSRQLNEQCALDDMDLMAQKRNLSICQQQRAEDEQRSQTKRMSLDDSYDALVNMYKPQRLQQLMQSAKQLERTPPRLGTHVDRFKQQHLLSETHKVVTTITTSPEVKIREGDSDIDTDADGGNVSYFFDRSVHDSHGDVFEQIMESRFARSMESNDNVMHVE